MRRFRLLGLILAATILTGMVGTPAQAYVPCTAAQSGTYDAGYLVAGAARTILLSDLGCTVTDGAGAVVLDFALSTTTPAQNISAATLSSQRAALAGTKLAGPVVGATYPGQLLTGATLAVKPTVGDSAASTTANQSIDLIDVPSGAIVGTITINFLVYDKRPDGSIADPAFNTDRPICQDFTLNTESETPLTVDLAELFQLGYCSDDDIPVKDAIGSMLPLDQIRSELALAGIRLIPVLQATSSTAYKSCVKPSKSSGLLPPLYATMCASPAYGTVSAGLDASSVVFTPSPGYATPALQVSARAQFFFYVSDPLSDAASRNTMIINVAVNANGAPCTTVFKSGPIFNDPTKNSKEFAITNTLKKMIQCAAPGSIIAMSWFSMTDDNLATALVHAAERGVNVRMLINSHSAKTQTWVSLARNQQFRGNLPTITTTNAAADSYSGDMLANTADPGSWLTSCEKGCLTPEAPANVTWPEDSEAEYPALHSKFFLFSHTGASYYVAGVASSNPTYEQSYRGWNNVQIYVGTQAKHNLYESLSNYFNTLSKAACSDHGWYSNNLALPEANRCGFETGWKPPTTSKALKLASDLPEVNYYAFPHATGGDDISDMLSRVKCRYVDSHGKAKRTKIYVNQFVFTRNSPAMKLWRLANGYNNNLRYGGCQIVVLYTDMDSRLKGYNNGVWSWIPAPSGKAMTYGSADCLSTYPTMWTPGGRLVVNKLFEVKKTKSGTDYQCKYGALQGRAPTIDYNADQYCWRYTKSALTGGTIRLCVTTPLRVNINDPADARAKLEPAFDVKRNKWYSHQKYMLIDGMYAGKITKLTVAGNTNWSNPALHWNDEIMTVTNGTDAFAKATFNAYLANFTDTLERLDGDGVKDRKAPNHCTNVKSDYCSTPFKGSW